MASMTVRLPSREGWHEVAKTQNYSAETRAKAIRLVRAHAGDYPSEYAAITAVASRLGMTAETLRKWIRQAEVDGGERPGVATAESREIRQLRRKVAELERTIEILSATGSSRGRTTRDRADLPVHRRVPAPVRGRADLPGPFRAWALRSPREPTGPGSNGRRRQGRCAMLW